MKQEKQIINIKTSKCLMGPWGLPLKKHYFYLELVNPGYLELHYEKFKIKDVTEIPKDLHAYGPKSPKVIGDIRNHLNEVLVLLRRYGYVPEKYNNDFICGRKYMYGSNEDEDYFVFIHAGQHRAACLAYLEESHFKITCDERIEPIIDRTMITHFDQTKKAPDKNGHKYINITSQSYVLSKIMWLVSVTVWI